MMVEVRVTVAELRENDLPFLFDRPRWRAIWGRFRRWKKVACLVTGVFPAGWCWNQVISHLEEVREAEGATVCGSAGVGWFSLRRRRQISRAVDRLSQLF